MDKKVTKRLSRDTNYKKTGKSYQEKLSPSEIKKKLEEYNTDDLSILAEQIISEMNTSMYTYEMAPVFTCIEYEITQQLKKLVGYNEGDSLFLPGGSICNITAINTARYHYSSDIKFTGNNSGISKLLEAKITIPS